MPDMPIEAAPTRKNSGKNLLRIARQASDSALRSVGLNRKASAKKEAQAASASQAKEAESHHAHDANSHSRYPNHPSGHNDHHHHQQQQGHHIPLFEVELGRNRSLPDIKPFSSDDHRTPARGSSLTNPKTNPGPFRSRQKPQNHLPNQLPNQHHQIATAMSNEPITSMTTADMQGSLQDAYGGTTDDWRQAQQAEQEARERQKLKDSSPTDRSGHISINSVSTLNLPPSNPTVTPPQTSSMSRILLPDRDRFHNNNINNRAFNSGVQASASLQGHDQFVEEPTQENTSLAKATTQPGGILSQLQAATEKGQVIDPITTVWSQKDGGYIQRSNTAPYPLRENRAIAEEEEAESLVGSGQRGPLEYSKSEGYGAASRRDRQQRRVQPQQDQQHLAEEEEEQQQPHNQPHHAGRPSMDQYNDLRHDPSHAPHHQVDQEPLNISRSRAMSHENVVDTNKDLPPTPFRQPTPPGQASSDASSRQHHQQQKGQRLRSDSQSETSRHQHYQQQQHQHRPSARSAGVNGPITSEESVIALSRSMSPPPHRRVSHERNASFSNINLNLTRGASTAGQQQHHHHQTNGGSISNVHKEHVQYGIDMLPLPVIPSPGESLKKNANLGILPQDVLKTLDPTTVQKVITVSVIASRVYKVLALEEVESLRKEQDDLQKYVQTLHTSLNIESRMRDASHSLIRLHESNTNIDAVKASTGQLHATTRKMDKIVQKTQESMERLLVIQRLLLQHESAVLNAGMRRLDGENRELSRTVLELETIRDQEKEEKLKWKKETSQLRIQRASTNHNARGRKSPSDRKSPSGQHLQVNMESSPPPLPTPLAPHNDARLAALEKYMKELNEEISKKDERIGELESQLRMVQVWADDFARSMKANKLGVDQSVDDGSKEDAGGLQKKLTRLQTKIENGFRALEANAYEMKVKAEEAELAKNKALEFTATTLANSSVVTGQQQQQQQQQQQRSRKGIDRPRANNNHIDNQPFTQHNNHSDLNMMLNDSLVELDHQISLTESSSPSTTPDLHDQYHHHHHQRRARSPSVPHQHQQQPVRRLSRSKTSNGGGSSSSLLTQQQQQEASDEQLALGNAQEEIRRLNMMVDELERLIHLKINV
ncbi:hypothetical protein BKA57DRAFT_479641 [Linnemannia elongata]|nr:hypothetical protein BKA57DRAFT_479641 [Linnemannia elongata]